MQIHAEQPSARSPAHLSRAPLRVGEKAPDFELRATPDHTVALSSFLGRPVVLVFYASDWSPVCGDQIAQYNELAPAWRKYDAQLLGISVDNAWSHVAYAHQRKLRFPILSDFEPKGEVARRYGVYDHAAGVAGRALFVLDRNGVIVWNQLSPAGVNPGADGILGALDALDALERGGPS